jgi:iron complex transport system permease protein
MQALQRKKIGIIYAGLTVVLLLLFVADVLLGSSPIPLGSAVKALFGVDQSYYSTIILTYRLPKALVALAAGVALATSGLQMQTVFRNPLADPYILGVSSGAGLGVALFLLGCSIVGISSLTSVIQNLGLTFAAWIGAAFIMLIMLIISIRVRDIMAMLILGMMIGSGTSALVSVLQYFSKEAALKSYVVWTMGSLGNITSTQLVILLLVVFVGCILALSSIKVLNAFMLGESYARSIGYNVLKHRTIIIFTATVLTGTVTAFCGPIGFIGVAVPHVARMILRNANHKYLMPVTMLLGASALLLCDILSNLPGQEISLPINTVTALLGIPIVILVIVRNQKIV